MKRLINAGIIALAGLATVLAIGCADAYHVKETTTTREYNTPVEPLSYAAPSPATTTTTVTQDNGGAVVEKRTTTAYSDPR